MALELLAAVYHIGQSKMEVVVQDESQTRRRINLTWMRKKGKDTPPPEWLSMVEGEVRYQQGMNSNPFASLLKPGF